MNIFSRRIKYSKISCTYSAHRVTSSTSSTSISGIPNFFIFSDKESVGGGAIRSCLRSWARSSPFCFVIPDALVVVVDTDDIIVAVVDVDIEDDDDEEEEEEEGKVVDGG